MALVNLISHKLFGASRPGLGQNTDDPEYGANRGRSGAIAQDNDGNFDEDHAADDDLNVDEEDQIELQDDNEIIRGVDFENDEEFQPLPSRRSRPLASFPTFTSISSYVSSSREPIFSQWFAKIKALILPPSSTAELEKYTPNYRHTPILSGIVIPFSILLEIPGLTEEWYIRTEMSKTVETKKNPPILVIAMALSMACALVANICLVMRFLEKRVKIMTLLCIIFLSVHDVINTTVVTIFGVEHRFNDGFTYGQPFWLTVCSTVASSFTNFTLIYDYIRTPSFAKSGSGLTRKQRSLVIVVIGLFCYIAFGSMILSFILHLSFIDALYFAVMTIETIGFGDITPTNTSSKVFIGFYATFGIVTLAMAVGLMRETVLEALEVGYRKRVQAVREQRRVARRKRRVESRWREAIEFRLREIGAPIWIRNDVEHGTLGKLIDHLWPSGENRLYGHGSGMRIGHGYGTHPHGMHLNLEALTEVQLESAAMEVGVPLEKLLPPGFRKKRDSRSSISSKQRKSQGDAEYKECNPDQQRLPLTHARMGRMIAMVRNVALAVHVSAAPAPDDVSSFGMTPDFGGRHVRSPLHSMSHDDHDDLTVPAFTKPPDDVSLGAEERRAFYARLTVAWTLFVVFWTVGSAIFMRTEGWSYGVAMYFCFVAFTTIGYGDYSPKSPAGRSIFVVWALLGVGTMTILISVISEGFSAKYKNALHTNKFNRAVKRYRLRAHTLLEKPIRKRSHRAGSLAGFPLQPHTSIEEYPEVLSESQMRLQEHLEALPHSILNHARAFHDSVRFFAAPTSTAKRFKVGGGPKRNAVPNELKAILDDIAGVEKIGERLKEEILQDDEARHTLFTLTVEKALRSMIAIAEQALDVMEERDTLAMRYEHHRSMHERQQYDSEASDDMSDRIAGTSTDRTYSDLAAPELIIPLPPSISQSSL